MSTVENQEIINTSNISTQYGLLSGGLMAAVLLMFQMAGQDYSPFLKLGKYLILIIGIVTALNIYKSKIQKDVFIGGIGVGIKLSLAAGLILVLTNTVLFLVAPELAFSKYGLEPHSFAQMALISGILFFETFVFGSLITFAVLQFLKGSIEL